MIQIATVIIFLKFKFNHGRSLSKVLRRQINSQDQSRLHPPSPLLCIDLSQSDLLNFLVSFPINPAPLYILLPHTKKKFSVFNYIGVQAPCGSLV